MQSSWLRFTLPFTQVIFSFLAIFYVLQCASVIFHVFQWFRHFLIVKWIFLIFHDFQFSCHIPRPTVDISKFFTFFSFSRHISRPKVCISHFPWFQVSLHIPGASVCNSHFSGLSVISSFFKSSSGCFSFSMIFSFLAIFHVLQWTFLNIPLFQFSSPYFTS